MSANRHTFLFLFLWLAIALLVTIHPTLLILWQINGILLLVIGLYDIRRMQTIPTPVIQRQVSGSLALGVWSDVTLTLYNASDTTQKIDVFDDYPPYSDWQGLPRHLIIPAITKVTIHYRIRPQQRGDMQFKGTHLRLHSPWQLWTQHRYYPLNTPLKIYPNFAAVTKYALFTIENRLGQLGIRQLQRRGEGLEFHQLREYRAGDTLRQINWNATSRLKKFISKEYQDERDQQVIFLLDCGRQMLAQDDTLSHFDHTLNAILLLTYVALRQGDALGLMTFSGDPRWIAPRKGVNTLNRVLNMVYDLRPSLQASDYLLATTQLIARHRRRALVILVSNLRDEESDELRPALKLLQQKHLVLVVSLQERIINEVLTQPVINFETALRYTATQTYVQQRHRLHETLRHQGILCLDVEPHLLPIMLVNQYLDIKRGRLL